MPELPEVETVRTGLEAKIAGFKITEVQVADQRSIRRNKGPTIEFQRELVGSVLSNFLRRGKFLWFPISAERCLVAHLGMSGQIIIRDPDSPAENSERVRFVVSRGRKNQELRFIDQRIFGGLYIDSLVAIDSGEIIPHSIRHIARDPLDPEFNLRAVASIIQKRRAGIKGILLNQKIVSGIGNIYADEILWLAKVHYLTSASSLSINKTLEILNLSHQVLTLALEKGGTSFDGQYKNVNGDSGKYLPHLNAYGRAGLPCKRCQASIIREPWSSRGSHICPRCQRRADTA